MMKREWNEEDITKVLKKMPKAHTDGAVFDRVWHKIEQRLLSAGGEQRHAFVWRPWLHPVRWAVAACLCLALAAGLHYRSQMDQADLAFFIESITNSVEEVTADDEIIQASVLLTDTSTFLADETTLPEAEH
jgi:hypothetical protein